MEIIDCKWSLSPPPPPIVARCAGIVPLPLPPFLPPSISDRSLHDHFSPALVNEGESAAQYGFASTAVLNSGTLN